MSQRKRKYRPIPAVFIAVALIGSLASACAASPDIEEPAIPIAELSSAAGETSSDGRYSEVEALTAEEAAAWDEEQEALRNESVIEKNTLVASGREYIYYLNGRTVDITKPSVAITYDDGPRGLGSEIMDTMELYGARCTFFLNGVAVHLYPEEVRRMQDDGFEIGNHSYNHPDMAGLNTEEIDFQVGATGRDIAAVTDVTPALMRLPYGSGSELVYEYVDMPFIQWSIDTLDWESQDAEAVFSMVIGRIRDGDIILMHEPYSSTVEATKLIVPELTRRGYQLLTVSELAALRGVPLESGQIYYCFWR